MDKDKRKLVAYTLAYTLLFSGCGIKFINSLKKDKTEAPQKDFTTSMTSEPTEEFKEAEIEKETIITMIETTLETEPSLIETTDLSTIGKTEATTIPTIEETESITIPTNEETEIPSIPTTEKIIEAEPVVPKIKNEVMHATEDTNIYSSNTTASLKIGRIKINEKALKILSCDNWTLVNYNNQIGYICNDYLKESSEFIETEYKHEKYSDVALATTDLNFRSAPSTEAEIISIFMKNTELEVIAKVDNGWLLVRNNGVLGYVHGDYTISCLDKAKEQYPNLNLTSLTFQKIIYSEVNDLNMRNGNSTEYEVLEHFEKYESARVISEYNDWYFVMTNEYNFGFINKAYTEELNDIFVLVDVSRQLLYLYNNNILYYVTPVITGKPSTPSDIGLFKIWYKSTNCYITDNNFTYYWSNYNYSNEGLHDAVEWRDDSEFIIRDPQKEIKGPYNGSNGCINMMLEPAKNVYENTEIGTKVLVHK